MKAIELRPGAPTLDELLHMAGEEGLILRTSEGREYILAEIDDLDQEIASMARNEELMRLLSARSRDHGVYSAKQVRERLGLKKK